MGAEADGVGMAAIMGWMEQMFGTRYLERGFEILTLCKTSLQTYI
jgi:hypothetical protein